MTNIEIEEMTNTKIEVGKYYRSAKGWKAYVVRYVEGKGFYVHHQRPGAHGNAGLFHQSDGLVTTYAPDKCANRIVAEWCEDYAEWQRKIVNEDSTQYVVTHTNGEFYTGRGFWFSSNKEDAQKYATRKDAVAMMNKLEVEYFTRDLGVEEYDQKPEKPMEQSKRIMSGLQLREWVEYRGYTNQEAAEALGLGISMFPLYLTANLVPEPIRLAVIGYEAERNQPITPEGRDAIAKLNAIRAIINGDAS